MVTREFSGEGSEIDRSVPGTSDTAASGSHAIVEWTTPADHGTESRRVTLSIHGRIGLGTLRNVAEQAGADEFDALCGWRERNR